MKRRSRAELDAQIKRLRVALLPMTRGTHWITFADVKRACKALGIAKKAR